MLLSKRSENISRYLLWACGAAMLSVFVLGGCSQLPPKPNGTVWVIDYPRSEIVGAPFGEFDLKYTHHVQVRRQMRGFMSQRLAERKPLSEAHKYICFDPISWDRFDAWVKEVQKIAERRFEEGK